MDISSKSAQPEENNELFEHYRIEADKGQGNIRIDKFLFHKLENVSRTKIQRAAQAGNILVNEVAVKPNYKIKPLDSISIVLPHPPQEFELIPEDIPLNIVFEDDDLLIINKEAGMVVHPGHGNYTGTLVNALSHYLQNSPLLVEGDMRPGLVHRIDKNTSGLMVVAKTEYALNHLAKQFFERTIDRKYEALVWGSFDHDQATIEGNIGRSLKDRTKMQVYLPNQYSDEIMGKHAITHYKLLEDLGYISRVDCKLETGRTHQIRVHMQHIGHPLFNDEKYGGDKILKGTTYSKYKQFVENCFKTLPRHALHAKSIGFEHPGTKQRIEFEEELPADMDQVIHKWRQYIAARHNN